MKDKMLALVKQICNKKSTDCKGMNKLELAQQLMQLSQIIDYTITEIPLSNNNQAVVLFTVKNDNNYYELFAGIDNNKKARFQLAICGTIKNDAVDFFEEEQQPIKNFLDNLSIYGDFKKVKNDVK